MQEGLFSRAVTSSRLFRNGDHSLAYGPPIPKRVPRFPSLAHPSLEPFRFEPARAITIIISAARYDLPTAVLRGPQGSKTLPRSQYKTPSAIVKRLLFRQTIVSRNTRARVATIRYFGAEGPDVQETPYIYYSNDISSRLSESSICFRSFFVFFFQRQLEKLTFSYSSCRKTKIVSGVGVFSFHIVIALLKNCTRGKMTKTTSRGILKVTLTHGCSLLWSFIWGCSPR